MRMQLKASPQPDRVFRAFSDRTRLRILHLLRQADGELCVCHLVDLLGVPQPTASRHLAYLRRAELVLARKDGLWMHYRLAPPPSELHRRLLTCVAECFHDVPELDRDARRLRKLLAEIGCCQPATTTTKARSSNQDNR